MTKEEFIEAYVSNSGTLIEVLEEIGFEAEPCDCDYEHCEGWKMVFKEDLKDG